MIESLIKDIRYAFRGLLKRPGYSVIVVITLALGIGANAAVFSVINAVLLRPLPYREADRVVTLWQNNSKAGVARNDVSPANFIDWSEQSSSFEAIAGIEPFGFALVGDGEPERFAAWLVSFGLALAGVAIGLGAALLLTRAIKSLLFGVSPTDPLTFLAISLLLLVTAFVASLIPARRATKIDPLTALRSE